MEVVLFGAGQIGEMALKNPGYNVMAIIDSDLEKHGKYLCGKLIIGLDEYKKEYSRYKILISSYKMDEIETLLHKNGICNFAAAPELYEDIQVPGSGEISHDNWGGFITRLCDKPGMKVLEIGSRNVTGSVFRNKFHHAEYTGFDYYPGENVDVVGDAHRLSNYFDEKFDLIFSSAVFEHLALPWLVSIEIIKLLKEGGYTFIETHYSFSSHERPWHFFQFSENALDVLFPEKFGMRCIKKGCSNLLEGRYSVSASEYLRGKPVRGLYCHSEYLGQKFRDLDDSELDWSGVSLEDVKKGTEYPKGVNKL